MQVQKLGQSHGKILSTTGVYDRPKGFQNKTDVANRWKRAVGRLTHLEFGTGFALPHSSRRLHRTKSLLYEQQHLKGS